MCDGLRVGQVGSANETACAPGTYNDLEEQESCTKCAAGKFQVLEGQTACDNCTKGCECHCGLKALSAVCARTERRRVSSLALQTSVRKVLPLRCRVPREPA